MNAWLTDEKDENGDYVEDYFSFIEGRPYGGTTRSDDVATTLANLHPKQAYTDANGKAVNVTALCFKNKMKPTATSHYSNNTEVWLVFSTRVAPVRDFKYTAGLFWQIYTSEQGVLPYVEIAGQKVAHQRLVLYGAPREHVHQGGPHPGLLQGRDVGHQVHVR